MASPRRRIGRSRHRKRLREPRWSSGCSPRASAMRVTGAASSARARLPSRAARVLTSCLRSRSPRIMVLMCCPGEWPLNTQLLSGCDAVWSSPGFMISSRHGHPIGSFSAIPKPPSVTVTSSSVAATRPRSGRRPSRAAGRRPGPGSQRPGPLCSGRHRRQPRSARYLDRRR
jgi:hypothetical protein